MADKALHVGDLVRLKDRIYTGLGSVTRSFYSGDMDRQITEVKWPDGFSYEFEDDLEPATTGEANRG